MDIGSRVGTLAQRLQEYGVRRFALIYGQRAARALLPAWALRFHEHVLVEGKPDPERVPTLRGFRGRIAGEGDMRGLLSLLSRRDLLSRYLGQPGFVVAIAEDDSAMLAMACAFVGPGDCIEDAAFAFGCRWRLGFSEAWLYRGLSAPQCCGAGVYLTAYRSLMEELARRGVTRCYGWIEASNDASLKAHWRLGLEAVGSIRYQRVLGVGRYVIDRGEQRCTCWTRKPSLLVAPASWQVLDD